MNDHATNIERDGRWRLGWFLGRLDQGVKSLGWVGLSQLLGLVVRLASNLIITRLLVPEAYGLFGTALAVVTTLEWLSDLGIVPALIRHPEGDTPRFLLTGWWMTVGRGIGLAVAAAMLAWPLSLVYEQPELFPVLAVLAIRPAIFALRSPATPNLRRHLNYRAVFLDELAQTVLGATVSLALAWTTHSLWSIVAGTIAGAMVGVLTSYLLVPMRPRRLWDTAAAQAIGALGRQVFVNTLVMSLWLNLDRILGLNYLTKTVMGYYAVAWTLASVAETLVTRCCDVHFSMLSRTSDPQAKARSHARVARKAVRCIAPIFTLGIVLAPSVINLLYDERYEPAGPLFAILIARLMVRGLGQLDFQYLLAMGDIRATTRGYALALAVQALLLSTLTPLLGASGLAWSCLLSTAVVTVSQTLSLGREATEARRRLGWTIISMILGLIIAGLLDHRVWKPTT